MDKPLSDKTVQRRLDQQGLESVRVWVPKCLAPFLKAFSEAALANARNTSKGK